MSDKIPDFTETELWTIRQAEAKLQLEPGDRNMTLFPVVYWRDEYTDIGKRVMTLQQIQANPAAN